ncbi:MAG TPA: PAS domain S-box protein [Steroidobacteraceae bacterium]|nr:PAS domain S-box protein [Steroidobacteraceae bacterium]
MSQKGDRRHINQLLVWLRERTLDFELAARSGGLGVWHWNLRTNELAWSEHCRELLGIAEQVPPSLEAFLAVVHPEDRQRLATAAAIAHPQGRKLDHEFRIILPNGETRWLHGAWQTHLDPRTGAPARALGLLLDVTTRRRADESRYRVLEEHARLWADAFLHNSRGIAIGDPATQTLRGVNPAYAALMGRSVVELTGESIWNLYPATEHARLTAAAQTADERGAATLHTCQIHRDGTLIPVELSLVSVRNSGGEVESRIAIVTDLRERLRVEGELRHTEARLMASERFRELADSAPVGILMLDGDGSCAYANPCWLEITGLSISEARHEGWREAIHPEDRERVGERWGRLPRGEDVELEFRYRTRIGAVRWVRSRAGTLGDGRSSGYLCVESDITEQLRQAEAVTQTHGRIRLLARRLQHLREEERDQLAHRLHGSLRQDLTTLAVELAALRAAGREVPVAGIARLAELSDRCLERLRYIAFELNPPGIDDLGLIGAVTRYVEECTAQSGLEISLSVPPSLPDTGRREAIALYRVCQEGLTNVIRHARAKRVEVTVSASEDLLRLRIKDDGIGMGEADRGKEGAFGLLAASERLNEIGGTLRVFGVAGEGTTLDASVPLRLAGDRLAPDGKTGPPQSASPPGA